MKETITSYFYFAFIIGCLLIGPVTTLHAGGLYLNEFATTSMGTAGAGAHALAMDASTAFHNPAGMTRLDGNELMVGAGFLYADLQFDPAPDTPIPGNDGGDAGGAGPILSFSYAHGLSEDWKLGLSVLSISAAVMDFDDGWTGRYYLDELTLMTVNIMPSVGYRVNNWLSLGGTFNIMYAELEQKLSAPPPFGSGQIKIDGDDMEYGFSLGALIEVSQQTRFGIAYFSEMEPSFSGDITLNPPGLQRGGDATITYPQFLKLSMYQQLAERWALVGTVGWEQWSAFENLTLSSEGSSRDLPRNWDDTWNLGLGVHYRPNDQWLLMTGFNYDSSPVDDKDRTVDMPMDRQIRLSLGSQYALNDQWTLGGYFTFADYGDAKIDQPLLKGEFENNEIYFFAFSANYKF